ncbi:hypothetical protein [Flavobacterium sp. RSP15]|nr:hypothetical protein [Flavobacterium sp. RSP15]
MAIERRHFDAWGNLAKLQQNGVAIALLLVVRLPLEGFKVIIR